MPDKEENMEVTELNQGRERHRAVTHVEHEERRPQSLLEAITAAATNPAIDISKVEKLIELQRQVEADHARREYYEALPAMQAALPLIDRKGTIDHGSGKMKQKYARFEDIYAAIQPILAEHSFSLTFRNKLEGGAQIVTAILTHGGHSEETSVQVGNDKTGAKNEAQAIGSALSYGKRYAASLLLNLTSRGEDDDGEAAGTALISAKEYHEIEAEMGKSGFTAERVVAYASQVAKRDIGSIDEIPAGIVDKVKNAMRQAAKGSKKPKDDPEAGEAEGGETAKQD